MVRLGPFISLVTGKVGQRIGDRRHPDPVTENKSN